MAVVLTKIDSGTHGYAGGFTVPSFTPESNSLILISVLRSNTTGIDEITSSNGDAVEIRHTSRFSVWGLLAGSSPVASTIVADYIGNSGGFWHAIEITGLDTTSISTAVVQSVTMNKYGGGTIDYTVTLSSFASSSNYTLCVGSPNTSDSAENTEIFEDTNGSASYKAEEDTSPSLHRDIATGWVYGLAMELGVSSGTSQSVVPIILQYLNHFNGGSK